MPPIRQMTALFLLVSALIVYGSLYPFSFDVQSPSPDQLERFFGTLHWTGNRGDVLGNLALFVPLGFVGAFLLGEGWRRVTRLITLTVWTLLLAFGLQAVQLYMPARDAALNDALWNLLGTCIGLLPGMIAARAYHARAAHPPAPGQGVTSFPAVLAGCWVAYRLAPYVPSLDWQSIKNSLKPLLITREIDTASFLRSFAGWTCFAALWHGWRGTRWSDALVLPMALAVILGEVLVIRNAVTLGNVAGAAAGLALWWALRGSRMRYVAAAAVMAFTVVWFGLDPFSFAPARNAFHLVPFRGFLGGSMYVNFQQLFLKFFLYGSLIWLLARAGVGLWIGASAVAAAVMAIEIAQVWLPGKTPEITDPLLVLTAGWLMHLTDGTRGSAPEALPGLGPTAAPPAAGTAPAPGSFAREPRKPGPRRSFLR